MTTVPGKNVVLIWTVYKTTKDDNIESMKLYRGSKQNSSKILLEDNEFPTVYASKLFGERLLHARITRDTLKVTCIVKLLKVQYRDAGYFNFEAVFLNKDDPVTSVNAAIRLSVESKFHKQKPLQL